MRVLIVGAGAVGQVYGRHLAAGGAEVGVYVRKKYAAACQAGLTLYPLNDSRDPDRCRTTFQPIAVRSTPEQLVGEHWDQVWLCISSTALWSGDWLTPLLAAAPSATIVSLQPGLKDRDKLLEKLPAARLVMGMIAFIAWQAPLPGESLHPPGIMYWHPPLSPSPFSGPDDAVHRIVSALTAGKCPAKAAADVPRQSATGSALLMPTIGALELAGWSLPALGRPPHAAIAAAAAREAMAIAAAWHSSPPPAITGLVRPWLLRLVTVLAPRLVPFDLQTYLRYHFTKVGDQTRASLRTLIEQGQRNHQPTAALEQLSAQL